MQNFKYNYQILQFKYLNGYLKLIILLLILHRNERINIMNITYTKCGDYLLQNLKLTEKENKTLNNYGLLRLEYLKNNKKALYQELLMKDKLNEHLFSVNIIAEDRINS